MSTLCVISLGQHSPWIFLESNGDLFMANHDKHLCTEAACPEEGQSASADKRSEPCASSYANFMLCHGAHGVH